MAGSVVIMARPTWPWDDDRTYRGSHPDELITGRLVVLTTEVGPTERRGAIELRELTYPEPDGTPSGIDWGYSGSGASRTAELILTDALGQSPSFEMERAFLADVIAHLDEDFRLRRYAVLRWVRGWCTETGTPLPASAEILPAEGDDYEPMPEARRRQRHQQIFGSHAG